MSGKSKSTFARSRVGKNTPPYRAARPYARCKRPDDAAFLRGTLLQVGACVLIFVVAVAVKSADHPFAGMVRETMSRTLNESTKMEDIAVFFNSVGNTYDEFKERAVAVFGHGSGTDEGGESKAGEDTPVTPYAPALPDGAGQGEPLEPDGQSEQAVQSGQGEGNAFTEAEPGHPINTGYTPRVVSNIEFPLNYIDLAELEDFDSGELRQEKPTLDKASLPFNFVIPLQGRITSPYGMRVHPISKKDAFHFGVDIGGKTGAKIYAAGAGKVKETGTSVAYGKYLIIEHEGGYTTFYGHCSKIAVKNGQKVKGGECVAYVGHTGWATGPHLHFEIRRSGEVLNPQLYLEKAEA